MLRSASFQLRLSFSSSVFCSVLSFFLVLFVFSLPLPDRSEPKARQAMLAVIGHKKEEKLPSYKTRLFQSHIQYVKWDGPDRTVNETHDSFFTACVVRALYFLLFSTMVVH
jgi:hypothetical protein